MANQVDISSLHSPSLIIKKKNITRKKQKREELEREIGRPKMVVGWYHSHPGFGCWLSGVDINTQQSFEALNQCAVAVVVDPIQSVKGKVVIDAFRLINP
ncbi:unnamed protein product [Lupinus luteus]|uniref:MPN domain-containing protein n=1 Tax=Lupinus luteus TaxID=3873 RepID=A0AAV1VXR9_LUPLU